MVNLTFINDKNKTILGIIFILLCIFIRLMTPYYIESYMLLLLIPAIGLIIPRDYIKNSHLIPIITIFIIILVICTSINGLLNPIDTLSYLYSKGILNAIPESNDLFTFFIGNMIVVIFALLNIICAAVYFIPTTRKKRRY